MSFTDELREWASVEVPYKYGHQLNAIADRIDAEHEKAMSRAGQLLADVEKDRDYNYANWQECKQKVLQGNITFGELNARIECLEDELSHCIELPKDADGVPIHVGDVMEKPDGYNNRLFAVDAMILYSDHWTVQGFIPCRLHHHEPTVEDVLMDLLEESSDPTCDATPTELAEKYAAKLRLLAEGEDA